MRRGALVVILAASGLVDGCGVGENLDKSGAAAELRKQDEQWSAAAARNDLEATLSFYADDAVVLPGNAPIAADKKAIREVWAGMLGPGTAVSWKVTKAEVAKSGELGYLYGTYELTMKDPKGGPPEQDKGKLVEIWKKQANGKWQCIVDIYNSDLAPPSAVGGGRSDIGH
jgi:ketosteroid isomerase-like protein